MTPRHKNAAHLFLLMFLQYGVLTLNIAAVAQNNNLLLLLTDFVIAYFNFVLLKKMVEAESKIETLAYVIGGALGAQMALQIGKHFFHG